MRSAQFRWWLLGLGTLVLLGEWLMRSPALVGQFAPPPLPPSQSPTSAPSLLEQLIAPSPPATARVVSFALQSVADQARIDQAQTSFLGSTQPTSVTQIQIYDLQYEIVGRDGRPKPVSAKVYLPSSGGPFPVYVFGSGTTGLADKCAPSLEQVAVENLGNYHNHMIAQAAAGYVTVFPDYEGFHDPEVHQAYFISESEAKVMLGAIKLLLELQPYQSALATADLTKVFVGGYSQGGHAALSTAQRWSELPSEVKLLGVLQFAGAADVQALFIESPWLASYLVASFQEYYAPELSAADVLQPRWLGEMVGNNERLCVNQAYRHYPRSLSDMYTPAFLDALHSETWPELLQGWQAAIERNTPLSDLPDVPYLSVQGEVDPIVTAQAQAKNTARLCASGKLVQYVVHPGVNHFQIRQAGFAEAQTWMRAVLAGESVANSCQP